MHPLHLLRQLKKDMTGYVSSKYPFFERGHNILNKQLCTILDQEGTLFQDPVLQLVRSRKSEAFDKSFFDQSIHSVLPDTPYSHQIKAWHNIKNEIPTVVATGTGSGKSECFMFPLIDSLLKKNVNQGPRKVCALLLYPMNALVEDQYIRLQRYTTGTGLRVGIYNGAFKNLGSQQVKDITGRIVSDKKKLGLSEAEAMKEIGSLTVDPQIPDTIPHILLTNYKMLEYMLLRPEDHPIFHDADIQYLVLDEAHSYTGSLGLELSCLLARLRVHLGAGGDHYLPIATSATLMQQEPGSKEQEGDIKPQQMMRDFFTQLFGKEFDEEGWLIEDEFVPPPKFDAGVITPFLNADLEAVRRALTRPMFSECLHELAGLYTHVRLDALKDGQNFRSVQDQWARQLAAPLLEVSQHLPALLLRDTDADPIDKVVRWDRAKQRFADRLKTDPLHLEALLILCAQAYEHANQPLLGLRVHVFGKSEPRTFWTLDEDINKRLVVDEQGLDKLDRPASDFISCRKCGHMAWAALAVPSGQAGSQEFTLKRVPTFYEDTKLEGGAEFVVLHASEDINPDVVGRKDWSVQNCEVNIQGQEIRVNWIQKRTKKKVKTDSNDWTTYVRIVRENREDDDIRDDWSCPACGATSSEDRRPVLLTPRGSGATDLSVYGAAVMSALEVPEERRLLFFCDNRQETSFLAGFLSDRHRRFNLRRAIASFFDSARKSGMQESWPLVCEVDPNRQPKGHRFDLAARILLSVKHGKFWGQESLPKEEVITRRDLVDLIPRDVLEVDWLDLKDRDNATINGYKNWLLDNRSIEGAGQETDLVTVQEKVELFHTDQGRWILQTMTEVILVEVSTLFAREGSLQNVGLATWGLKGLGPSVFEPTAIRHPEWKLGSQGLFLISHWLLMRLAEQG
ncbi:MAG: DEAD/DEAH box helicase, partial [Pseudobdellovibrionaceae bacterium]|nr:DEAD/DEAH box helicase [Pseudobdellovibrionaceae bacterium]